MTIDSTSQVLVFDADGVMIKPWGFANALATQHNITPEMTQGFFTGVFQQCLIDEHALEDVLPPFLHEWGWSNNVESFIDFWHQTDDLRDAVMLQQVADYRAAGRVCCLASNQDVTRARYMRSSMDFDLLFDRLYFSCDLKAKKPELAFYHAIQQDLGVPASNILFYDDSEQHVKGAISAGWQAVWFRSYDDLVED